jgi:hypothetical protein
MAFSRFCGKVNGMKGWGLVEFKSSRKWLAVRSAALLGGLCLAHSTSAGIVLTNPVVFVTQPPIPRELNSTVSNTFLSVVTIFGNQQADTAHAARGGDLWLLTTNLGLVNLTRNGGFGTNGIQHGVGIGVRDPAIHWSGTKVLFSMVTGSPTSGTDTTSYFWQLYELTNLAAVIANTNTRPAIVRVANQPAGFNNVTPTYATDGRIIFMSDRPYNNLAWLYPQLDEYKGEPTISGTYSLDPASGDLKMIQHTPSGAFNPFIDSFGRLIMTRWDHLSQDPMALDDRLGRSTNGAFNFLFESPGSPIQSTNIVENFTEPRNNDTNATALLGVNGNEFNMFLPWALDQAGGNEEVLNHVGRHELIAPTPQSPFLQSFTTDTNLYSISNLTQRAAAGVISPNTNSLGAFFQITEDPRSPGTYFGVQASDIAIFGGTHGSGQILTLTGGAGVNPTNMIVSPITAPFTASPVTPNNLGLFRNPLPMSDGRLLAAYSPPATSATFGFDTNIGTASLPVSQYRFRLMALSNAIPYWTTNQYLTPGIAATSIYWDGATLVTNTATLWELQPVEVRSRPIPTPVVTGVAPIEQQVFAEEGVDLPTFQADLAQRGLALVISRNVTARDGADRQQPYNLRVPGGASSIANSGKVYDITHLQYLQADFLRGYTNGPNGPQPGRRILATPMHATTSFNYASSKPNAPQGGTELMSDGSQATFIPANRAVTWQLTGTNNNDSLVKERYWISFRPGEVRTCANCHGINAVDQLGRTPPTNAPLALRQVLRLWRTNAANSYTLTVNNGSGGGNFGAGSILSITANPAPSGKVFANWTGTGVGAPSSITSSFIMPTNNTTVTAMYSNLPPPNFTAWQVSGAGSNLTLSASAFANQSWILQASADLTNWVNIATNSASGAGTLQFPIPVDPAVSSQFYRLVSP